MRLNWHQKAQSQLSLSDRLADRITGFAGTMIFIYIHIGIFIVWCSTGLFGVDKFPFNFLTLSVSLEAIFLATLVMISQNRQAIRDKVQAEHQYEHQEEELLLQTKILLNQDKILNKLVSFTKDIHEYILLDDEEES